MDQLVILVAGPTGVGKTDFVEKIVCSLQKEFFDKKISIINADMGQFYEPISIGTAKPENLEKGRDYLFGIINEPTEINVTQYRKMVLDNIRQSLSENKIPIIVGGSGFYLRSLFYLIEETPPTLSSSKSGVGRNLISKNKTTQELWQELQEIDHERAKQIPINDRYRIERALYIWHSTGIKPSSLKPKLNIPFKFKFIYLTRSRPELYNIIDNRVIKMIEAGWIDEVKNLDQSWIDFLKIKKIIGYPEIIEYLEHVMSDPDNSGPAPGRELVLIIQQKTRNYAKRQETFFRQLVRDLNNEVKDCAVEYNLTLSSVDLYIDELIKNEFKRLK